MVNLKLIKLMWLEESGVENVKWLSVTDNRD
jgi:hypothetical protein